MSRKVLISAESRRLGRTPVLMKYEDVDTSTSEEEDSEMDADASSSPETKKLPSQDSKKRKQAQAVNKKLNKKLKAK